MSRTMKDSGIEWIGDVPEEWEVRKIKYLSQVVRGGSPRPAGDSRYYGGNIPFMKVADITKDDKMYVDSCEFSIKEAGLSNTRMINPQTLLLTNSGATLGVPKINTFSTTFNDGIAAFLNLSKKLDLKFAYYSLKARTKFFLDSASLGIGQPNLNTDIIGSTFLTLPPLAEQHLIATFLDKKCSEIDSLIELQEQMIEELKAYKQSVITEVVTKGLNPDAPMRDSGIEWIGQIPEHWEVGKMKNIATGFSNGTSTTQLTNEESPYAVTRIETISTGNINYEKVGYVPFFEGINKYELVKGDILISNINSLERVGNSAMYNGEQTLYHGMNLLRVHTNDKMIALYLHYYLRSKAFLEQMKSCCNHAINQVSVSSSTLKNLFVAIPNIAEQQAIADYLDKKCGEIDELITIKQQKIESLKEYKKSVIYEYVTGKREV